MKKIKSLLFAIMMIAVTVTVYGQASFVEGQLYYGSQAAGIYQQMGWQVPQNLEAGSIYTFQNGRLVKYCPNCPQGGGGVNPYPQPYPQPPVLPVQPQIIVVPMPQPSQQEGGVQYIVTEQKRDGWAKFADFGRGFGNLATGAGILTYGVAGVQGKLAPNYYSSSTNNNYYSNGGGNNSGGGTYYPPTDGYPVGPASGNGTFVPNWNSGNGNSGGSNYNYYPNDGGNVGGGTFVGGSAGTGGFTGSW